MNLRYKLMNFLSGRNGSDALFFFTLACAFLTAFINCFVHAFLLQIIVDIFLVYAAFRFLSKNTVARAEENRRFMQFATKLKNARRTYLQRRADYTHIYKKCPACHAVLRLPRRKGKHTTVCPKCSKSFKVQVFKGLY